MEAHHAVVPQQQAETFIPPNGQVQATQKGARSWLKRVVQAGAFLAGGFVAATGQLDAAESKERVWKDNTGKFTVNAIFVESDGVNVKLRKDNGKEITVPFARLSARDQGYLEAQKEATPDPQAFKQDEPVAEDPKEIESDGPKDDPKEKEIAFESADAHVSVTAGYEKHTFLLSTGLEIHDDTEYFTVRVTFENKTKRRRLEYPGWGAGEGREDEGRRGVNGKLRPADADDAILKDDAGNTYPIASFLIGASPDGFFGGGTVDPGKTIHDVLIFEDPLEDFEYLDLKLPYETGDMQFRIPASMVKMPGGKSGGKADKSAPGGTRPVSVGGGAEKEGMPSKVAPGADAVEELLRIIRDTDKAADTRFRALVDLEKHGPKAAPAIPLLKELLRDSNPDTRTTALRILIKIGKPSVSTLIEHAEFLRDDLGKISNQYRRKLARRRDPATATQASTQVSSEAMACRHTIQALGEIGPDAKGAVPLLLQAVVQSKKSMSVSLIVHQRK
jgi:hypothetical protein